MLSPSVPWADPDISSKETEGLAGLGGDGINGAATADFLVDDGAEILCEDHSGKHSSVQFVVKVEYLLPSSDRKKAWYIFLGLSSAPILRVRGGFTVTEPGPGRRRQPCTLQCHPASEIRLSGRPLM